MLSVDRDEKDRMTFSVTSMKHLSYDLRSDIIRKIYSSSNHCH